MMRVLAIDNRVEYLQQMSRFEHTSAIVARGYDTDFDTVCLQRLDEIDGCIVRLDPLFLQMFQENSVLHIADGANSLEARLVIGPPPRQVDVSRFKKALNSVVARLAINISAVLAVDIEGLETISLAFFQELIEHLFPGSGMNRGRPGNHAIHIKNYSI